MANTMHQIKLGWLKTMETIGNTASKMANRARVKTHEIKLETRKRELLSELSRQALQLWQEGTTFPAPLEEMLGELGELETQLTTLQQEKAKAAADENAEAEAAVDVAACEGVDAENTASTANAVEATVNAEDAETLSAEDIADEAQAQESSQQ